MPLYEYRCANSHEFEKFYRSIGTASADASCPVCGASGARVMSAAGLVFKGSGFYITDYGKDGKKAERDAATATKKEADSVAAKAAAKSSDVASTSGPSESKPSSSDSSTAVKSKDTAPAAPASPAAASKPAPAAAKAKTSE